MSVNVVMHRPELVRSWVSDILGMFDPDYVWHDLAQIWQTPGDGEQLVDTFLGGTSEDAPPAGLMLGIPFDIAASMAAAQGPEMGRPSCRCTGLPRQPAMADAGRELEKAAARPGLPYWPPRTPTSAQKRCGVGRLNEPERKRKCSTG